MSKKTTKVIVENGNDYLIGVKKNQPKLYKQIEATTDDESNIHSKYSQLELNKGRIDSSKANIELLSNSWLLAHDEEKAAFVLEHYVLKFNDFSLYYKLGHIYVELENWEKAKEALESVVADKHIKTQPEIEATAWLLLGISSYHRKDTVRSTQALNKALAFKETRAHARWWLNQIKEEISNQKINKS